MLRDCPEDNIPKMITGLCCINHQVIGLSSLCLIYSWLHAKTFPLSHTRGVPHKVSFSESDSALYTHCVEYVVEVLSGGSKAGDLRKPVYEWMPVQHRKFSLSIETSRLECVIGVAPIGPCRGNFLGKSRWTSTWVILLSLYAACGIYTTERLATLFEVLQGKLE